eukprot:TRINITY_DN1373_c0_g1_i2.p1 TRINITY_DN1373_c0_g1~~TRINITY_DN1373_c0_g1_i2.p1  ORF type:complete len:241 (-),score=59.47 TRINITY_DN1373_c0_g1_i2:52-774(-)
MSKVFEERSFFESFFEELELNGSDDSILLNCLENFTKEEFKKLYNFKYVAPDNVMGFDKEEHRYKESELDCISALISKDKTDLVHKILDDIFPECDINDPVSPPFGFAMLYQKYDLLEKMVVRDNFDVNLKFDEGECNFLMSAIELQLEKVLDIILQAPDLDINWEDSPDHPLAFTFKTGYKEGAIRLLSHPDIDISFINDVQHYKSLIPSESLENAQTLRDYLIDLDNIENFKDKYMTL